MEEAPENGNELSHSAHSNRIDRGTVFVWSGNVHSVMVLFVLVIQVRVLEKCKEMFLENTLTMFNSSALKLLFPWFRGHVSFFTVFIRACHWILL
jgi:hypothetical protein